MRWTLAELFRRDEPPAAPPPQRWTCEPGWCVPKDHNPGRCRHCGTPMEGNH